MKHHILFFMLLFFSFGIVAFAQEDGKIENETKYAIISDRQQNFELSINQLGNANNQTLIQNAQTISNFAQIIQLGSSNESNIKQNGDKNISLSFQYGSDNYYDLDLSGYRNFTLSSQVGNNNSIEQDISGNSLYYLMTQFGNNNEIIQLEDSPSSVPYMIHQWGNGMKIKVINGGIVK